MKRIYLIAIIVAVITGIAVFNYATYLETKTKGETASVIVAVQKIPEYTVVTSSMVAVKTISIDAINSLAVTKLSDVEGKICNVAIEANEQVLRTRLKESGTDKSGIAYAIPEGKRAITIQVDLASGVAGSLTKGSRVDIAATVLASTGAEKVATTMMVLENVEVMLTGTYTAEQPKDDKVKSSDYTAVTLAVSPEEALKLSYFITEGKLRVLLRSNLDKSVTNTQPYKLQ